MIRPDDIDVETILAGIVRWAEHETPTSSGDRINGLLDMAEAQCHGLPINLQRIRGRDGFGDHLVIKYDPVASRSGSVLLLCHVDTVWELETITRRPVRVAEGRVYGPGIYDMKAGAYLALDAICRLAAANRRPPRPITLLLTSDEEVGSPTSREPIEGLAKDADFVLVPEPGGGPEAAVVTSRKGWGRFTVTAVGRSAHAGSGPQQGRSAIREIAHQILTLEAMNDRTTGSTVNVGIVSGGTRPNVVPAHARVEVDLRVCQSALNIDP